MAKTSISVTLSESEAADVMLGLDILKAETNKIATKTEGIGAKSVHDGLAKRYTQLEELKNRFL